MEEKKKETRRGKHTIWRQPHNLELVTGWARNGLNQEQIAHNMGVSESTLKDWKNRYPEFEEALRIGREVADLMVENALFKRACGGTFIDEKIIESEKDGKRVETLKRTVVGDVTAQQFWLKNRKPDVWKEKREEIIKTDGEGGGVIFIPSVNE